MIGSMLKIIKILVRYFKYQLCSKQISVNTSLLNKIKHMQAQSHSLSQNAQNVNKKECEMKQVHFCSKCR